MSSSSNNTAATTATVLQTIAPHVDLHEAFTGLPSSAIFLLLVLVIVFLCAVIWILMICHFRLKYRIATLKQFNNMDLHHLQRQPSDASSYQLYGARARRVNTHDTHDRNVSLDVSHTYDYHNTHKHQDTEIFDGDSSALNDKDSNHTHNLTVNQLYQPHTSMDRNSLQLSPPQRPRQRAQTDHEHKKKRRPTTAPIFDTENKPKKRAMPKIIRRSEKQPDSSKSQELDGSLCSYVGLGFSQKSARAFLPRQVSHEQSNQSYIPCITQQKSETTTADPFFVRNKSIEMHKFPSFPTNHSPQKKPKKYRQRTNIRLTTPVHATHSKNRRLDTERSNASSNTRSGHSNQQYLARRATRYHGNVPGQTGTHRRHQSVPASETSSRSHTNGMHSRTTSASWTSASGSSTTTSTAASSEVANKLRLQLQCDDDAHSGKDEEVEIQVIDDDDDVDKENLNVQNSLTLQEERKCSRSRRGLNDKRRRTVTDLETPGARKSEVSKTQTAATTTFVVHNDDSCLSNVYDEYEDEETESYAYDVDKMHSNMVDKTISCDRVASYQLEGI